LILEVLNLYEIIPKLHLNYNKVVNAEGGQRWKRERRVQFSRWIRTWFEVLSVFLIFNVWYCNNNYF
jgi:hypothetical protein